MLNELLIVERGAKQAGVDMGIRHPDIKTARNIPTIIIGLDAEGKASSLRVKPDDVKPWTLGDGMHNRFPFVQPKPPLLVTHEISADDELVKRVLDRKNNHRRLDALALFKGRVFNSEALSEWPGAGLLERVQERLDQTRTLSKPEEVVVPHTLERFLKACSATSGASLLKAIFDLIANELISTASSEFVDLAISLLLGKYNKKKGAWENCGGIVFEATGCQSSIIDSKLIPILSDCLNKLDVAPTQDAYRVCGLTGVATQIIDDTFPQPNVFVLGPTYLFAKNVASMANTRYKNSSVASMPVGVAVANELAAAFRALTEENRRNVTWRPLPGESPKQTDLFLAFVESVPDAPVAGLIASDDSEDFDDSNSSSETAASISAFEKRTERLVAAVRAEVGADFRKTPARLVVFRKVDPANRKVVYSNSRTIGNLYDAAILWRDGEKNYPDWLTLLSKTDGRGKAKPLPPPHVAPLGLIAFSKRLFRRGGFESTEVTGIPATEALNLFLDSVVKPHDIAHRRVIRLLRLFLRRRLILGTGAAHALRRNVLDMVNQNNREALRTVTVISVLLNKLNRSKEQYMSEIAFKLGQLLAAADVVHAGYCADVRAGSIPPSLLGNQVFTMAQSAPVRALAVLSRRWKPYVGWAMKLQRSPDDVTRVENLRQSKQKADAQKGWDIKKALRSAREMKSLAESISQSLGECQINDMFRAELLLGYMAGLPPTKSNDQ